MSASTGQGEAQTLPRVKGQESSREPGNGGARGKAGQEARAVTSLEHPLLGQSAIPATQGLSLHMNPQPRGPI